MYFWYWYWENPNKNPSIILAKFRYLFDTTYNAFSIKPNELKSASRCLIGEYEYPFCFAEIYSWVCLYLDTTLSDSRNCVMYLVANHSHCVAPLYRETTLIECVLLLLIDETRCSLLYETSFGLFSIKVSSA